MEYTSKEHVTTLDVACPHYNCLAPVGKPCLPKHKRWSYKPPEAAWYTHEARHVAYQLWLTTLPKADRVITLNFDDDAYRTDKLLIADVDTDVKAVLAILGKYGSASAA